MNNSKGKKMKTVVVVFFVTLLVILLGGCGKNSQDYSVEAVAAFEPSVKSEINWVMLPGGGLESLQSSVSYCINLKIINNTGKSLSGKGLVADIVANSDAILEIVVVPESKSLSMLDDGSEISLDLDGYAFYLSGAMTKKNGPLKLYLGIGDKTFKADLPEIKDIVATDDREVMLELEETTSMPNREGLKPVKANDWPKVRDIGGPPALARKQDGLVALYLFYTKN